MKRRNLCNCAIITGIFLIPFFSVAQKVTETKLLGCWKLNRFEFLTPVNDSAAVVNASKNYISCFETNGRFVTKQKTKTGEKLIGTGTYKIDADGRTIHQQRDLQDEEDTDEPAEVVLITDQKLDIKTGDVIMHLERVRN